MASCFRRISATDTAVSVNEYSTAPSMLLISSVGVNVSFNELMRVNKSLSVLMTFTFFSICRCDLYHVKHTLRSLPITPSNPVFLYRYSWILPGSGQCVLTYSSRKNHR